MTMPEDRGEAEDAAEDCDAAGRSAEIDEAGAPAESDTNGQTTEAAEADTNGQTTEDAEATEPAETDAAAAERRARLEAAKRSYRATLRNEADTGGGGFSEDYYRSQKPPHWS